jgi:hypothetical protein
MSQENEQELRDQGEAAHKAREAKADARIAELGLKKGATYAFLVRRASANINGNDYAEGLIVGDVEAFGNYSGTIRLVEVNINWARWVSEGSKKEGKINLLLRDIVNVLREHVDYPI